MRPYKDSRQVVRSQKERVIAPKGKPAVKEIIDAHFHRNGLAPEVLAVVVRDRSADGGTARIEGPSVLGVHGGFIDRVDGGRIPLHRVVEVTSRGRRVWPTP